MGGREATVRKRGKRLYVRVCVVDSTAPSLWCVICCAINFDATVPKDISHVEQVIYRYIVCCRYRQII